MNTIENLKEASDELYSLLLYLNRRVFNHEEIIKRLSIPPSHAKVIFYLLHSEKEAVSVSDIAKNLSISKSNMTPIIDKLIKEDLVERFTDPNDRRVIRVKTTQKGHEFSKEQRQRAKSYLKEKISVLPPNDLEKLAKLAKQLNLIITKLD